MIVFILLSISVANGMQSAQPQQGQSAFPFMPMKSAYSPFVGAAGKEPRFPLMLPKSTSPFVEVQGKDEVIVPSQGKNSIDGNSIPPYETGAKGGLLVNAFPPPSTNAELSNSYFTKFVGRPFDGEPATPDQTNQAMLLLKARLEELRGTVSDTLVLYSGCCEKTYAISWTEDQFNALQTGEEFTEWMEKQAQTLLDDFAQDAIMIYEQGKQRSGGTTQCDAADEGTFQNNFVRPSYLLFNRLSKNEQGDSTSNWKQTTCRSSRDGVSSEWNGFNMYAYPRDLGDDQKYAEKAEGECAITCRALSEQ